MIGEGGPEAVGWGSAGLRVGRAEEGETPRTAQEGRVESGGLNERSRAPDVEEDKGKLQNRITSTE